MSSLKTNIRPPIYFALCRETFKFAACAPRAMVEARRTFVTSVQRSSRESCTSFLSWRSCWSSLPLFSSVSTWYSHIPQGPWIVMHVISHGKPLSYIIVHQTYGDINKTTLFRSVNLVAADFFLSDEFPFNGEDGVFIANRGVFNRLEEGRVQSWTLLYTLSPPLPGILFSRFCESYSCFNVSEALHHYTFEWWVLQRMQLPRRTANKVLLPRCKAKERPIKG